MITDVGRGLVARKLSGVTDSCFDYLSLGIGARPVVSTANGQHQSGPLTAMKHEVVRVPVTTAMPLNTGKIKCVAEVPSSLNCEFTEVALWTHSENSGSNRPQSESLSSFHSREVWKFYDASATATALLSTITSASGDTDYASHTALANAGTKAMHSPYNDLMWLTGLERRAKREGFRLDSEGIVVRGDMSSFSTSVPNTWAVSGDYIFKNVSGFSYDASAAVDEIGLAYFLSTTAKASTTAPTSIRMSVQFITDAGKKASWNMIRTPQSMTACNTTAGSASITYTGSPVVRRGDLLTNPQLPPSGVTEFYPTASGAGLVGFAALSTGSAGATVNAINLANDSTGNAYFTDYVTLQEPTTARMAMKYDADFKWANVTEVRVYADVDHATPTNYWLGLDSLIFTNTDKMNSTYGMVAYDIAFNYETRGVRTKANSPTNVLFEVSVV